MLEYVEMARDELDTCALLAAEAFYDYEYFTPYVPNDRQRRRFLDAMIRCEFKANWGRPGVLFLTARDNGRIVAVSKLCTPDFTTPPDIDYIKAGWFGVLIKGGIKQVNAWNDMDKKASAPCSGLPRNNWYLSLFTVSKADKRKGIGSKFLSECLIPYARTAGGETFSLFTNSEANCRFYEKNGFSLFDERSFEHKGETMGSWSYKMELT